jgi:hypothetical protein
MFNKKAVLQFFVRSPLARAGYPIGVVSVFLLIFLSTYVSYSFFSIMVQRTVMLPDAVVVDGTTFHLDAYRSVAPKFAALRPKSVEVIVDRAAKVMVLDAAPTGSNRGAVLEELLKKNRWSVVRAEGRVVAAQLTSLAMKESFVKESAVLVDLLTKKGFVIGESVPISEDEEFDLFIIVGAY